MYHDKGRVDEELPDGIDLESFKIYLNENVRQHFSAPNGPSAVSILYLIEIG